MPVSPEQSANSIRLQYIIKYLQDRIDEELLNGKDRYIDIVFSECPVEFSVMDLTDELKAKLKDIYKKAGWKNLGIQTRDTFFTKCFWVHLSK